MGIIARQGVSNSIAIFIGFFLGGLNTVFIFPYVFRNNLDDLGLIQLLVTISFVIAQLLTFGAVGISIRYYPKMKSENRVSHLMFYVWVLPSLALFMFGIFLLIFGNEFIQLFINQEISISNTTVIILIYVLTIGITFSRLLAGYSSTQKRTFFPSLLNEVGIRIVILLATYFYFIGWIDFESYSYLHLVAYGFPALALIIYLFNKELFTISKPNGKEFNELFSYGFFTWMDIVATWVINRIDQIMIGIILLHSEIPVYNFAFYMSMVVALPNRSLILVSAPVIAESFHKNDMENIQNIYTKSSIVQLLLGGFIFTGIWINMDTLLKFEPSAFYEAKLVFLFLGISKLIDIFFSVNGTILVTSQFYKYNLIFNLILLVITIILNMTLIPLYGITGAAIATAISLIVFNIMKGIFLYNKFKLQPFHPNTVKGLLLLTATFLAGYYFPVLENVWIDLFVRSALITIIFIPGVLIFKISEDINDMFNKITRRFLK